MNGKVEVNETYVGRQDEKAVGRNEGKKMIMVVAVERKGRLSPLRPRGGDCGQKTPKAVHAGPHRRGCRGENGQMERLQRSGKRIPEAGAAEIRIEREDLPAAPQDNHDVQGLAQGHPPFGVPLTALYR